MRISKYPTAILALAMLAGCSSGISLDEPIEGPTWQLEQLGSMLIEPSNDPAQNARIQFDRSGRVNGSGGCNRLSGTYERTGNRLKLGQLGATRMACANPAVNINETQFFAALQATDSYWLQNNRSRLILLDASGRTVATLTTLAPSN